MELSRKQTEFWAVILLVCLVVSAAIMLVDFQIKQAILEESTRLRLVIEGWEVRQSGYRASKDRATNDATDNGSFPGPVLVESTTGMEAGNVSNGGPPSRPKAARNRRHEPSRKVDGGEVPPGDK